MINFKQPTLQTEYQGHPISVFAWGDTTFLAQFSDEYGHPVASAPKLYDTVDAAVNVCKDLIDFIYGDVATYQERPEPTVTRRLNIATARPTGVLPRIVVP